VDPQVPLPPPTTSTIPDDATEEGLNDLTGPKAQNRVLHIDTRWFRYGINDRTHAAAMMLSFILLISAMIVAVFGVAGLYSGQRPEFVNTLITWIGNAFLFTTGIAVGRSVNKPEKNSD
jgi:hypothetical protein